jgi:serine/threonine protein kinase
MYKHFHPCNINHLHDAICLKSIAKGTISEVNVYQCKDLCGNLDKPFEPIKKCDKIFLVKKLNIRKSLFKPKYDTKAIKTLLLNEYNIGMKLNGCINIRETYDIDLVDNCLLFEYCKGVDLFGYLHERDERFDDDDKEIWEKFHIFNYGNRSKQRFDELMNYFNQLLNGIDFMHSKGIAHMDLKLENLMINLDSKILKIIDFGDARIFNNNGKICKECGIYGTYEFMAPEIFKNAEYNPEKVDIWGLGIILYELLYNSIPWKVADSSDNNYKRYIRSLTNCNILPNDLFHNTKFDELFTIMLNPNPDERTNIHTVKNMFNKLINKEIKTN